MASIQDNPWIAQVSAFRKYLRISHPEFDAEIEALVSAACADLARGGITASKLYDISDPLVERAISLYVKAGFGLDNPDSAKYDEAYQTQRRDLMLTSEYITAEEAD